MCNAFGVQIGDLREATSKHRTIALLNQDTELFAAISTAIDVLRVREKILGKSTPDYLASLFNLANLYLMTIKSNRQNHFLLSVNGRAKRFLARNIPFIRRV